MKTFRIVLTLLICFASFNLNVNAQSSKKTAKDENKLTINQKVSILAKELKLTEVEQIQIKEIFTFTQNTKAKLKTQNLPKKEEKKKVEKAKDDQKAKLRKLLGAKRFEKYTELKKKDII